jgi:hypothetical protein
MKLQRNLPNNIMMVPWQWIWQDIDIVPATTLLASDEFSIVTHVTSMAKSRATLFKLASQLTGSFLKKTNEVRVRINHLRFHDFQPSPATHPIRKWNPFNHCSTKSCEHKKILYLLQHFFQGPLVVWTYRWRSWCSNRNNATTVAAVLKNKMTAASNQHIWILVRFHTLIYCNIYSMDHRSHDNSVSWLRVSIMLQIWQLSQFWVKHSVWCWAWTDIDN